MKTNIRISQSSSRRAFDLLKATTLRALEKLHYQQWWSKVTRKEKHPKNCDCDICIK